MQKKQHVSVGKLAAEAGLVGAAAAVAGAYFLYGTKAGIKQTKHVRGWMLKMKGEALEQIEHLEDISEKAYKNVVDRVADQYSHYEHVDKKELREAIKELKAHWGDIQKEIAKDKKTVKREVAKVRHAIQGKSKK